MEIVEEISRNISVAPIMEEPFRHTVFTMFNNDYADQLIADIKTLEDKLIQKLGDYPERFVLVFEGNSKKGIKSVIPNIELDHNSVLWKHVNNFFLHHIKLICNKYGITKKVYVAEIMVVCDYQGYALGPHTDSMIRSTTMVTYLPDEEKPGELGLHLYRDKINRHRKKWKKIHYKLDDTFEFVKQVPYHKGSTVDFRVCDHSYHGVDKINDNVVRRSIQLFVRK